MPMEQVDTIWLVSCVRVQRATSAPARDLYRSDWFLKARTCVESVESCWFILSAEYGRVHPDEMIEPYEMTLGMMGVAERRNWSRRVQQQMDERMPDARRIVVLAGQRYREFLMDYLVGRAATVHVPLAGMRNGQQLRKAFTQWPDAGVASRIDFPPIVAKIPRKPPKDFAAFDQAKPDDTDFQLQQGLAVANAMAAARNGLAAN
jgi:hypothetical protein